MEVVSAAEQNGHVHVKADTPDVTINGTNGSTFNKRKTEGSADREDDRDSKRRRGTAPIKEEYLVHHSPEEPIEPKPQGNGEDDDAAEAFHHEDRNPDNKSKKSRKKNKGQNKNREFGHSEDAKGLCSTRAKCNEFAVQECQYGETCRFEHDLRKYLEQHKGDDLTTFDGVCPVWQEKGKCNMGWKCRFVKSHSKEVEREDGRKELVLIEDTDKFAKFANTTVTPDDTEIDVVNNIDNNTRMQLVKKKFPTPRSDKYIKHMDALQGRPDEQGKNMYKKGRNQNEARQQRNSSSPEPENDEASEQKPAVSKNTQDHRATFVDPALLPAEKRRLYFGPDTPTLAPLTTQGNLPFRRLCNSLGASFTYSEMAMSMPLLTGQKSEWALMKAHESEIHQPTFLASTSNSRLSNLMSQNIVFDSSYTPTTDLSFGAQISANKPWLAIKTAEVLSSLLPNGLRAIDLNCGCPIDLVYRDGAGSALMDAPNKLDKMLRGMNTVSGAIPVTVKIRTGTRDKQPTAQKLVERLVLGADRGPYQGRDIPCGVGAITLHGRSRQQRYTREADWNYITDTASLIKQLNITADMETDTIREADERDLPPGTNKTGRKTFFLGNGDVYSHEDYYDHLEHAGIDAVMVGRGALIKPWIFEEIRAGQYLDKSSSERLSYIRSFVSHGLSAWGTDTHGLHTTRRFLLEYLAFTHRYIPVGLLEHLPPKLNERPPRYRGRDEMETLLASDNYLDWMKIAEMFLGKAGEGFKFVPKHKSNSYDTEQQG